MIISSLLLIFLFGCIVSIVVFLGLQQSAEWAKVMAEPPNNDVQLQARKREIAPPGIELHSNTPTVARVRKP